MTAAVVVGAGPNGLAGAVALAAEGIEVTVLEAADTVGGGTRSAELTVPGVIHDVCSAIHPFGAVSPCFEELRLDRHGLRWRFPEVDLAHPLDGGRAGVMVRSIEETAEGLGTDGDAWRQIFEPLARDFGDLVEDLFRPMVHVPSHRIGLLRFGLRALPSATLLARRWKTDEARGLFAGAAAHVIQPLSRPSTASVGLMLLAAGHHAGWPVAEGGSQAVADALVEALGDLGGKIETGTRVRSLAELPPADITLLDVAPRDAVAIAGDRLPSRVARAYRRWRHGPGAFKLDLAVEGGVPWTNEACRRAGTVHVGGTLEEVAFAEREAFRGRMPKRPFVLVGQQYLADPGRSAGDVHPIWTYCHVPNGSTLDATEAVLDQLERFAPGLRERIVGRHTHTAAAFEAYNPNYVGGDIATGANDPIQLVLRPRIARDPYATGIPGVYLCSAATPPGGGVHGMCGLNAARAALRDRA